MQQGPPALQEHRAIIELDRQQIVFVEAFLDRQQITNLPRTGTEVVTAIADGGQCLAVEDATVGGPQAMVGGIDQRG